MHRWLWLALVGCGRVDFDAADADGTATRCDEPWSAPQEVFPPDTREPSIRGDGLELYVANGGDLLVSTRASRRDPFSMPALLAMPPNTTYMEFEPSISDDGFELFFSATVTSNSFTYQALRTSVDQPFGAATMIGIFGGVDISHDRLTLYSSDYMAPIRVYRRPSIAEAFGQPTELSAVVNAPGIPCGLPSISGDDLDLYFVRDPSSSAPVAWVAHRATPQAEFTTVERLDIPNFNSHPDISADGHFLYYQGTDYGLWVISRCE